MIVTQQDKTKMTTQTQDKMNTQIRASVEGEKPLQLEGGRKKHGN